LGTGKTRRELYQDVRNFVWSVSSPFLGNVYLHYVFDLWVEAWRKKVAHGDVVVVRYADDGVVGFEHREDAERFLVDLQARFRQLGLEVHPDKTRLIEFGPHAIANQKRCGEGKPETFDFLGFVRHEVAYAAVMPEPTGHNLVFCHQYPTQTCGWSNPAVWSSGDNVASSFGMATKPWGAVVTVSIKAVRELGWDGMASTCELQVNVVRKEQAKDADRLEPKGTVIR
jgi:hypothetical protein